VIKLVLGRTIKDNGGSYRKYEVEVTKEIEPTRANLSRQFAILRRELDKQVEIDEKVD